ncbi:MAG: carboxylating nicotinate-nucleotide diphosphorylase [Pseudomonadota bacterium]
MSNTLNQSSQIKQMVTAALTEDIGDEDVTANLLDDSAVAFAHILCREDAVLCGQAWFDETFRQCDSTVHIEWQLNDGDAMRAGQTVCEISGNAKAMVTAERTALNFLQTLSGTATVTRHYMTAMTGTECKLLDTRKTIPLLRNAQKYAVVCGGGVNHRIGLYDGILIKENHIEAAGSVKVAIERMRAYRPGMKIEIEVENLAQLEDALSNKADILLLDNFSLADTKKAVEITAGRAILEASGGFEYDDLAAVAQTGVDFISVGALTKHLRSIDFSMRFSSSFQK